MPPRPYQCSVLGTCFLSAGDEARLEKDRSNQDVAHTIGCGDSAKIFGFSLLLPDVHQRFC